MFHAKRAKRQRRPLKVSMEGLSGGGKTYTALRLAFAMRRAGIGKRLVVIDSENESAGLYAGVVEDGEAWDFDTVDMPRDRRNPTGYTEAYEWAVGQGYDIVIFDSLSHAWHGALQAVDSYAKSHKGDKFGGWADITPQQQMMIQTLTDTRAHCISTMRVKSEFQDQEVNGRTRKVKVGMRADQRDNTEYEYDLVLRFEASNEVFVEKVRGCSAMNGRAATRPGPAFFQPLFDWWLSAEPVVSPDEAARAARAAFLKAKTLAELGAEWAALAPAVQARVLDDKDRRKAELTRPPTDPPPARGATGPEPDEDDGPELDEDGNPILFGNDPPPRDAEALTLRRCLDGRRLDPDAVQLARRSGGDRGRRLDRS
jgi:hypothetical protein